MSDLGEQPGRVPWERWDGETTQQFHAFALYRDLLGQRSIMKVVLTLAAENGKDAERVRKTGGNRRRVEGWSSKFSWVERAEAYDDYLERRFRAERESRIERAEADESALASTLIYHLGRRVLGDDPGRVTEEERVEPFDPRKVDEKDVPALLERAVRIRRLSDGQPTDVLRGNFSISMSEVSAIFRDVFEIVSRHIPEERLDRVQAELDSYLATRRLPGGG